MTRRSLAALTLLIVLGVVVSFAPLPATAFSTSTPRTHEIKVEARRFDFSPNRIRVNQGERVIINLAAVDVVHGLYIDGYAVQTTAQPGVPTSIEFVADQAGKFRYRCSVSCGTMHPFMIGELVVAPNLPFRRAIVLTVIAAVGTLLCLAMNGDRART